MKTGLNQSVKLKMCQKVLTSFWSVKVEVCSRERKVRPFYYIQHQCSYGIEENNCSDNKQTRLANPVGTAH